VTENIGRVRNPLTIIAIFAGIAEVSGTAVLPFVNSDHQQVFIWFLIVLPTLLVILFFLTLNFNGSVLYAPSDFKDEGNYMRVQRFDQITQTKTVTNVTRNDEIEYLRLQNTRLEYENIKLKEKFVYTGTGKPKPLGITEDGRTEFPLRYSVVNFENANSFIQNMSLKGYPVELYRDVRESEYVEKNPEEQEAIWLGNLVPFAQAKEIILEAKRFFPWLKFIHISGDKNENMFPEEIRTQVFLGGSSKTAREKYRLREIDSEGFSRIEKSRSIEEISSIVREYY
jgi:hypothetical protein